MSLRDAVLGHPLFTNTRLYSLFSDFRKLKEANPEGYEANLIAWKSLIDEFFQRNLLSHRFVLDTDGFLETLVLPEYGKPLALGIVLEELIKTGGLVPLKQFETEPMNTRRWGVRPVVSWAVNKFVMDTSYKLTDWKNNLKADKLISRKALESFALEISQKIDTDNSKKVFTQSQFQEYVNALDDQSKSLSDLDFDVLLKYLHRDLQKIKIDDGIIKVGNEDITEQDRGILQLRSTLDSINEKSAELTKKIDDLTIKIKQSLKNNNKELAKNLLRSKKIAQDSLNKQVESLAQLESVLYKLDEASNNIQILNALDAGSTLLKDLNTEIGGVSRVEDIMNKLEDEKLKADEISNEIIRFGSEVIDNDEIDEEYEEMLRQETEKNKIRKNKEEKEEKEILEVGNELSKLKVAPSKIKESLAKEALHS
jgi:charged multivesicular body protein 7